MRSLSRIAPLRAFAGSTEPLDIEHLEASRCLLDLPGRWEATW
jgi:hypothetical protein